MSMGAATRWGFSVFGPAERLERRSISQDEVVPVIEPPRAFERLPYQVAQANRWATQVVRPLQTLGHNWDSYGGRPLDASVAELGIDLLTALVLNGVPPPRALPTADGGLSVEWHEPTRDLVIWLSPQGEPSSAYYRTESVEWDIPDIFKDARLNQAIEDVSTNTP